jgi:hypothetical protein
MDMTLFVETIVPLVDAEDHALHAYSTSRLQTATITSTGPISSIVTKTTAGYMGDDFMNNYYRIVSWYETLPAPQILQCLN